MDREDIIINGIKEIILSSNLAQIISQCEEEITRAVLVSRVEENINKYG